MQTALSAPAVTVSSVKPLQKSSAARSQRARPRRSPRPVGPPLETGRGLPEGFAVTSAIPGNQFAIQTFLNRQLHRPSVAEFTSASVKPGYRAADRLIIKSPVDRSIVSHLQLESQEIRFGTTNLPVIRLRDIAILPEYRSREFGGRMLIAAEREAKQRGAMLMLVHAEEYPLLRSRGWTTLGSDPISVVSPQRLLGQLPQPPQPESPFFCHKIPERTVRIGRLTDLDELRDLFIRRSHGVHGTAKRTPEHWSWLMTRNAHDQVYVFEEDQQMVAYVVVRGASVIELVDITDDHRGAAYLLRLVGADAIDQGRHALRFHLPLTDPVHSWADQAGGQLFAAGADESWMVKIISRRALLRRLAAELHRRRVPEFTELGISIAGDDFLLRPGRRSFRVTRDTAKRHQITVTSDAATHLLLGYRSASELHGQGQLAASTGTALSIAQQLFPTVMLWRACWDDLPVLKS